MAKKQRIKVTGGGATAYLWGDIDIIGSFIPGAVVEEPEKSDIVNVPFRGGIRRRFPGGPGVTFSGGTRSVVTGAPAKRTTLPGNPVKMERNRGIGDLERLEVFQVTLEGPFTPLLKIARARANPLVPGWVLRSPNGKPHKVEAPDPD